MINLFVWSTSSSTVSARRTPRDGYNAISWSQGSFNLLAVPEIPGAELGQFVGGNRRLSQ